MYSITELKKDTLISVNNAPYRVIEYRQTQMGRGGSIVNTKLKNLLDGKVLDRTFKGSEKVAPADVSTVDAQFLYQDAGQLHCMDSKTYDQFSIASASLGDGAKYLKEGELVKALVYNNRVISLELPTFVFLTVTHAEPGVRGDTATAALKNCEVETGAHVQVPLFIKTGDTIKVDTRSGSYVERQK